MLFHELYGSYYNATAAILPKAVEGRPTGRYRHWCKSTLFQHVDVVVTPQYIEYYEKDDCFRLVASDYMGVRFAAVLPLLNSFIIDLFYI